VSGLDRRAVQTSDLMSVRVRMTGLEQIEPEEEIVIGGEAGFTDLVVAVFCGRLLRGE